MENFCYSVCLQFIKLSLKKASKILFVIKVFHVPCGERKSLIRIRFSRTEIIFFEDTNVQGKGVFPVIKHTVMNENYNICVTPSLFTSDLGQAASVVIGKVGTPTRKFHLLHPGRVRFLPKCDGNVNFIYSSTC